MIQIRMTSSIFEGMKSDLNRSHPYADERVGFAFLRYGTVHDEVRLLLISGYLSLPEDAYEVDKDVGARINSKGIRLALKRTLQTKEGILHVHMHSHQVIPQFSETDLEYNPQFVKTFRNANPEASHGALLISKDSMYANIWLPQSDKPQEIFRFNIVGRPFIKYWRKSYE